MYVSKKTLFPDWQKSLDILTHNYSKAEYNLINSEPLSLFLSLPPLRAN
jgi:hypothetical protein